MNSVWVLYDKDNKLQTWSIPTFTKPHQDHLNSLKGIPGYPFSAVRFTEAESTFVAGFNSPETYNDTLQNDVSDCYQDFLKGLK